MNSLPTRQITSRRLMRLGAILFILGLLTGLAIPMLTNPRMGLSSHLEGVMNGTFLLVLGLIWNKLRLSRMTMQIAFWLVIYGTYTNWATILAAAVWGAGNSMMPIAGMGYQGSSLQEGIINFGLVSLTLAILPTSVIVWWGLRGSDEPPVESTSPVEGGG